MIEAKQQAYLDAMDVPVWCLRQTEAVEIPPIENRWSLKLGPGSGGALLICANDSDPASKLASDISRTLGKVPVWSWPDDGEQAVSPALAVDQNLFTTVAVFGSELAEKVFGRELPLNLNSARLVLLPSMRDLETQAEARKLLWAELCRSGMVFAN